MWPVASPSPVDPAWAGDEEFMALALAEAAAAARRGEVPVGAVVIGGDGQLLAGAGNRTVELADPAGHAEILALREAGRVMKNYRLADCTVYVTLEPCVMCAGAMVHARIKRLVYGAIDPKGGGVASLYRVGGDGLLNHRFAVTGGVSAEAAAAMLKGFFRERRRSAG
ncbi:MAG: nucleoside deaminase [Desulfobulbaceae bacterium]|nr:nucleoside deaminase [Desulfobulbaceae bacterium]